MVHIALQVKHKVQKTYNWEQLVDACIMKAQQAPLHKTPSNIPAKLHKAVSGTPKLHGMASSIPSRMGSPRSQRSWAPSTASRQVSSSADSFSEQRLFTRTLDAEQLRLEISALADDGHQSPGAHRQGSRRLQSRQPSSIEMLLEKALSLQPSERSAAAAAGSGGSTPKVQSRQMSNIEKLLDRAVSLLPDEGQVAFAAAAGGNAVRQPAQPRQASYVDKLLAKAVSFCPDEQRAASGPANDSVRRPPQSRQPSNIERLLETAVSLLPDESRQVSAAANEIARQRPHSRQHSGIERLQDRAVSFLADDDQLGSEPASDSSEDVRHQLPSQPPGQPLSQVQAAKRYYEQLGRRPAPTKSAIHPAIALSPRPTEQQHEPVVRGNVSAVRGVTARSQAAAAAHQVRLAAGHQNAAHGQQLPRSASPEGKTTGKESSVPVLPLLIANRATADSTTRQVLLCWMTVPMRCRNWHLSSKLTVNVLTEKAV